MTVVTGVVTVVVVPAGRVTVTAVTGVVTVALVGSVGIGRLGGGTLGTCRSNVESAEATTPAVVERGEAEVAASLEPNLDSRGALPAERVAAE